MVPPCHLGFLEVARDSPELPDASPQPPVTAPGDRCVEVESLAADGQVSVELSLKFGPVEPERRDSVVQIGAAASVREFARQHERSGDQVCTDALQLVELFHGDHGSDRPSVTLDENVLTTFRMLDKARNTTTGGFGNGHSPLVTRVSEDSHNEGRTENCVDSRGTPR